MERPTWWFLLKTVSLDLEVMNREMEKYKLFDFSTERSSYISCDTEEASSCFDPIF